MPGRDLPDQFYSVHFSCLFYIGKPGKFKSEVSAREGPPLPAMACTPHVRTPNLPPLCNSLPSPHPTAQHDFLDHLRQYSLSCTRFYYLRWLDAYNRGMQGRLPPPYYTGPKVPVWDAAHDEVVRANRLADGVTATDWMTGKELKKAAAAAAARGDAAVAPPGAAPPA